MASRAAISEGCTETVPPDVVSREGQRRGDGIDLCDDGDALPVAHPHAQSVTSLQEHYAKKDAISGDGGIQLGSAGVKKGQNIKQLLLGRRISLLPPHLQHFKD